MKTGIHPWEYRSRIVTGGDLLALGDILTAAAKDGWEPLTIATLASPGGAAFVVLRRPCKHAKVGNGEGQEKTAG